MFEVGLSVMFRILVSTAYLSIDARQLYGRLDVSFVPFSVLIVSDHALAFFTFLA